MTVQEWLGDNQLGIDIWTKKYRYNNETFDEWLDRVSGGDEDVRKLIKEKKFLFGGRILSNRGLDKKGEKVTYSNCYVMTPPDDNIESIFDCAKKLARTYSYGGGCGIDISKLAPRGAKVTNTAKETSGSVSFMDLYSLVTGLIGQNGRRGALMLSIDCHHPDLEEFIGIKSDLDKVTKANISVRITDDFMEAVKKREEFTLSFMRVETGETIEKTVDAYEIFKKFSEMNWDYAEPGMLFWDRISNYNLVSEDPEFSYSGVNPCAEEPLPAGGSCLLGSVNLSEFVKVNKEFDFNGFDHTVEIAIKALNNVLKEGLPLHPLQEQRDSVEQWRQIGLGIMGLADMLIKMGIRYGSKEAIEICDKIGFHMADTAIRISAELAKSEGTYPKYKPCVMKSDYLNNNTSDETVKMVKKYGLYNSQLLTTAPTGCQKRETFVSTEEGIFRLDELVNIHGEQWQDMSDSNFMATQIHSANLISKGYVNGYASTKKITLSNNVQLEATYNHKYKIIRNGKLNWCRADELCVGDIIPNKIGYYNKSTNTPLKTINQELYHGLGAIITLPSEMNDKLAFILGAYYANGSNHTRGRDKHFASIRFSMNTEKTDDISKICNLIFDVFGICPTFSTSSKGSCTEINVANINLCRWLEKNNLKKDKSTNSIIPLVIRTSSKNVIQAFLDGYYMCDGSSNQSSVYIDTSNYQMAQDLVGLYRAIGKDASIRIDAKRSGAKSKKPMYRVFFGGYKSLDFPEEKLRYVNKEKREMLSNIKQIMGNDWIYDTVTSIENSFNFTLDLEVQNEHYYLANGYISHNSLSSMLGVSGGIEPIYANYYTRKTESLHGEDKYYKVYTPIVERYMKEHDLKDDSELPEYFVTAQTLDYRNRIDMQSVWQKHIDASISSTVNVPNDFTVEETEDLYMYAWEKGLKGVTIFRDGCKRAGILTIDTSKKSEKANTSNQIQSKASDNQLKRGMIIKADDNCIGKKRTLVTGCGTLHCEAFFDPDNGELLETYLSKGSQGGCNNFMVGLSRMISLAARGGIDIYTIVDQLKSSGTCPSYAVRRATKKDTSPGSCCPVAVGNALIDMYKEMKEELDIGEEPEEDENKEYIKSKTNPQSKPHRGQRAKINPIDEKAIVPCPECGEPLSFEGGCNFCRNCGYSRCD